MQSSLSLIINVVLLMGIIVAIYLHLKSSKNKDIQHDKEPEVGSFNEVGSDDIIAVRKVTTESQEEVSQQQELVLDDAPLLVMYLFAGKGKQFVGYELLQALLTAGMRFGDMNIFHRHQSSHGRGPVLFSLANAQEPGTFELQKMGAFTGSGLCLFMRLSGNSQIDNDRFNLMLETADQLREDLQAVLLDDNRKPMTEQSVIQYQHMMNNQHEYAEA